MVLDYFWQYSREKKEIGQHDFLVFGERGQQGGRGAKDAVSSLVEGGIIVQKK